MPSISEKSFGQRFEKSNQLLSFLNTVPNYAPNNNRITVAGFTAFLNDIQAANMQVSNSLHSLAMSRADRIESYFGSNGLKNMCMAIRDSIGAMPNGRESAAYKSVQKLCQKFTNYRKPSKKALQQTSAKQISQSELSFGSLYETGNQILSLINNLPNYSTPNPHITVAGFSQFLANLLTLNRAVSDGLSVYRNAVANRQNVYNGNDGLQVRVQEIKSYIAAQFGKKSSEYSTILKIKF